MFEDGPFHEIARLRRDYENTVLTDKVEYHYIQLPKFKKKCERISSKLDQWLTFILTKNLEDIKTMGNEYIKKAGEKLEYLSNDEETRRIAELIEKGIRDEAAALAGARNEGIAEGHASGLAEGHASGLAEGHASGLAEGLAEGEKNTKIQTAKKMLEEKLDINLIIKITGLTKEEIENL